jgi:hypothetical protein
LIGNILKGWLFDDLQHLWIPLSKTRTNETVIGPEGSEQRWFAASHGGTSGDGRAAVACGRCWNNGWSTSRDAIGGGLPVRLSPHSANESRSRPTKVFRFRPSLLVK